VLVERRTPGQPPPGSAARERPRRRSPVAERDAARALPAALRHTAPDLRLVQPLPPLGRGLEDCDLDTLAARAAVMDPAAAAELWWRVAPRALGRLALRVGDAAAAAAVPALVGRILDELADFDPARDSLAGWLDATVDRYAGDGPTVVQPLVRSSMRPRGVLDPAAQCARTAMERTP
jgi:hypothetical protein